MPFPDQQTFSAQKSWHFNMSELEKQFLRKEQIEVREAIVEHAPNDAKYKQNLGDVDMSKYLGHPVVTKMNPAAGRRLNQAVTRIDQEKIRQYEQNSAFVDLSNVATGHITDPDFNYKELLRAEMT